MIVTEESYTSKASFMDNDAIPVYKNGQKNQSTFRRIFPSFSCITSIPLPIGFYRLATLML
uniref:hypothetical protein n=1 Tax=Okeania sp. SIO2F4 TaxID=2607790 RepID=UPI0025F44703|nr:hypothetical protein [Okeania sp. SIO2F4]